ncbi:MAG: right-handed parallel beta-helix repeat-containing protein, partial [Kofleriaceae bacterium]
MITGAVLVIMGCKETNPAYCPAHGEDPSCGSIDAPTTTDAPIATPCSDNLGCKSAIAPVCDISGGAGVCVLCTATDHALCKDTTPICADHMCQACRNASDCPLSAVCLASGACADEGDVAYVDPMGSATTSCTKALPCMTVASGLATVTALGTPRPYLKLHGAIDEAVTIARDVAVFADPDTTLTRESGGPILTVTGTAVVEINDLTITRSHLGIDPGILTDGTTALTLKRVKISESKGHGVSCAGNSLTVSGSTFSDNGLAGISCSKGSVAVTTSTFTKNFRGGLVLAGGSFDVTNNFVYDNGDKDSSDVGGVFVNPMAGTMNRFEFNTVIDNHARDFPTVLSAGLICDVPSFAAANNLVARNDVAGDVHRSNANIGGRCTYPTSA